MKPGWVILGFSVTRVAIPTGDLLKRTYPIALIAIGLLTMLGGAAVVFSGSPFAGLWTVVAISIGVGFVTANFGRVGLLPESRGDDMLRAAVCAVLHLSYSLLLVLFIGGMARAGGDAAGVAGLILLLSLLCVTMNLVHFAVQYRRDAAHKRGIAAGSVRG